MAGARRKISGLGGNGGAQSITFPRPANDIGPKREGSDFHDRCRP